MIPPYNPPVPLVLTYVPPPMSVIVSCRVSAVEPQILYHTPDRIVMFNVDEKK